MSLKRGSAGPACLQWQFGNTCGQIKLYTSIRHLWYTANLWPWPKSPACGQVFDRTKSISVWHDCLWPMSHIVFVWKTGKCSVEVFKEIFTWVKCLNCILCSRYAVDQGYYPRQRWVTGCFSVYCRSFITHDFACLLLNYFQVLPNTSSLDIVNGRLYRVCIEYWLFLIV